MAEDAKDIENTKMHVRDEFVEVLMSSNAVRDSTKGTEPTKKQAKMTKAIEGRMNRLFEDKLHSKDAKPDDAIALAQSYLHISQIYSDVVVKEAFSETYLLRSLKLLEGREATRKAILTAMKVLNCLGRIYVHRKDTNKSELFFEKALTFYWNYTDRKDSYPAPIDILYVFGIVTKEFQSGYSLDREYMSTLSSLLNLHAAAHTDAQLQRSTKWVTYEHMLLRKQVRLIPLTISRIDWALKVATLSYYLSLNDRFTEARNHLGIAFYMLNKFYRNEYERIDGANFSEMKATLYEQYNATATYINWYAVCYGTMLLHTSKNRLLRFEEKDEQCERKTEFLTTCDQKLPDSLIFTSINNIEDEFNTWITDKYIVHFNDAEAVFLRLLRCLNEAQTYHDHAINKDPEMHAKILQLISYACKYLTCYEENEEKQVSLHSWRLRILEESRWQLETHNKTINFKRFSWLEQAITHVTIVDTHLDGLHIYQRSKVDHMLPDINSHIKSALSLFKLYLDSV
ncbi:PREDICTED: uncharacterized protein LOC106745025 [Dinoponera quadriceps]|uniref:KIF-binding protein n=1 Tax=Dinoponera quadriceps TaxID=609295 RepID=A0A6P3XBI7_DINQU|nr:PREDICTED: uncharacterized protein LOC106745025 [Dinoponera quadriceps]